MRISYEQKRNYRRKFLSLHRSISRIIAAYQTPELFWEPANSTVRRNRAVGFFPQIQTVWSDPESFEEGNHVRRGVHSVWYGGLPIDFELTQSTSDVLLVVFHGALEPTAALPIFSGSKVTSSLDVARLSFTDPSLYLSPDLALAWHAGNQYQPDLQQVTTRIIKKVAKSTGAKQIILFGSSGGGFASLIQAAAIPRATAVVANAQTNALLYHKEHVDKYLNVAWEGDRDRFIAAGGNSAVDQFRSLDAIPRVFYMQNSTDTFHIEEHLTPFVRSFEHDPNMQLLIGNWGEGHIAPPKDLFWATLKAVAQNDTIALKRIGFGRATDYKLW